MMAPEWPTTTTAAIAVQKRLAHRVIAQGDPRPVGWVAGADACYRDGRVQAAAVLMRLADLAVEAEATACLPETFPYRTGLLSFREAPAVLDALSRLPLRPDLLLVDGHGLAHPRRFGLACHVGVLEDVPTIGVAKSRLIGRFDQPAAARGSWTALMDGTERIGAVVRTRTDVKPVFVSVGHRIGLEAAIALVLACAPRHRVPEPLRASDRLSRLRRPLAR